MNILFMIVRKGHLMGKDDLRVAIKPILKTIRQPWKWVYGSVRQRNVSLTIRVKSRFRQRVSVSLFCMPIILNRLSKKNRSATADRCERR